MSSRCEQLREKALNAGLDSGHALAWQAHCRSCNNCRTELMVLETLERQVREKRCHLSQNDVASLLQAARKHHPPRTGFSANRHWVLRCACALGILLVMGMFLRPDPYAVHAITMNIPEIQPSPAANYQAAVLASAPVREQPSETLAWPMGVPEAGPMQERMHDLRRRLETRRESLLDLIDRDMGDSEDDEQSSYQKPTTWS